MLRGITGKNVDLILLKTAVEEAPSLFIDCSDCANPFLLDKRDPITLAKVRMLPAESLYRFKATLEAVPKLMKPDDTLIVSTFGRLFGYGNKDEELDIALHAFEFLKILSLTKQIFVGVSPIWMELASKYCDSIEEGGKNMGHTVTSQRILSDRVVTELLDFGKTLRADEREHYERLVKGAFKHFGSISYTSSLEPWALVLVSIAFEQEKRISALENELFSYRCIQAQQ